MEYIDSNPDTLLIVTADHETGGLQSNLDIEEGVINHYEFTTEDTQTRKFYTSCMVKGQKQWLQISIIRKLQNLFLEHWDNYYILSTQN